MPTPESAVTAMIRRPKFLEQPGAHTGAQRDSQSLAERSTAVHGPYRAERSRHNSPWYWVAALALLCLMMSAPKIAGWLQ